MIFWENLQKRNGKGTDRSFSVPFTFERSVPVPFLLEKKWLRFVPVPHFEERVPNAFLNERVPPIPWANTFSFFWNYIRLNFKWFELTRMFRASTRTSSHWSHLLLTFRPLKNPREAPLVFLLKDECKTSVALKDTRRALQKNFIKIIWLIDWCIYWAMQNELC